MNISELSHISRPLVGPLRKPGALERLTAIVGALAVTAGLFLYAGGWFTPGALTPAAIINTFQYVNGVHPGFRRNHAKGSVSPVTSRAMARDKRFPRHSYSAPAA